MSSEFNLVEKWLMRVPNYFEDMNKAIENMFEKDIFTTQFNGNDRIVKMFKNKESGNYFFIEKKKDKINSYYYENKENEDLFVKNNYTYDYLMKSIKNNEFLLLNPLITNEIKKSNGVYKLEYMTLDELLSAKKELESYLEIPPEMINLIDSVIVTREINPNSIKKELVISENINMLYEFTKILEDNLLIKKEYDKNFYNTVNLLALREYDKFKLSWAKMIFDILIYGKNKGYNSEESSLIDHSGMKTWCVSQKEFIFESDDATFYFKIKDENDYFIYDLSKNVNYDIQIKEINLEKDTDKIIFWVKDNEIKGGNYLELKYMNTLLSISTKNMKEDNSFKKNNNRIN